MIAVMLPHNSPLAPADFQQKYVTAPSPPGWVTRTRLLLCRRNISAAMAWSWVKDKTFKEPSCSSVTQQLACCPVFVAVPAWWYPAWDEKLQMNVRGSLNYKHPPRDGVRGKREVALKLNAGSECRDPQTPGWPSNRPKEVGVFTETRWSPDWKQGTLRQKWLVLPKDSITPFFVVVYSSAKHLDLLWY